MFRRGTRYPSAPSPGRPSTARISSLSSGETSSSASTERIQSLVACSRAKFFWAANPGHGRTQTRSVNSRAIWPVLSLDSASTTTSSSAQVRLSRQALSRSSSLRVTTTAETLPRVILAGAARPVASAGGLTQARPGCVPHVAFHSTGAREAGGLGGWPDTGATRLCSSYRLSFHRRPRGRWPRRVACHRRDPAVFLISPFIPPAPARPVASAGGLTQARPGCVPHIAFHSTGGREAGGLGGWLDTGATRLCSSYRLSFHRRPRGRFGRRVA